MRESTWRPRCTSSTNSLRGSAASKSTLQTLIGRFTVTGREEREPKPEEYTITSALKLPDGDLWLLTARVKYGDKDMTVPIPLEIKWAGDNAVALQAETEDRVRAALEVFREKLVKRNISLKALDASDPKPSGKTYKIDCKIIQGIDTDKAKAIGKKIRDEGPKGVSAQIQGDQLRVTGKKKDDLQAVIGLLKSSDFGVALQFTNYR